MPRLTGPVCPAIKDDKIGTMGKTQGVKASSSPASAKTPMALSMLPEASVCAIVSMALLLVGDLAVAARSVGRGKALSSAGGRATLVTALLAAPKRVSAICKAWASGA